MKEFQCKKNCIDIFYLFDMTPNFYLQRKLYDYEKEYSELEIIQKFQIIIILAEPGAGKTSLLESFSNQLNVKKKSANTFINRNNQDRNSILIIDALDELVRIDQSAVSNLLGKAADLEPKKIIISSRSSEWEESYTSLVRENFEIEPRVFRLFPFNESEQQQIFENYKPLEDFKKFESEVTKYNLEPLLSNPQFLKIFADAYIESNRVFSDRKFIFNHAVKASAKESNNAFNFRNDLPIQRKLEFTEEIFAKILLSGAEGVSTNPNDHDTLYPRIDTLITLDSVEQYLSLLSSKLFKLADNVSLHQPSHKIIAEFTAANYLVKRINANRNNISLHQCLSIIAPNGIVRDELRGLVAWMAALGNKSIQETLINIDPYAVLANGDPSQLLSSSKKFLLEKLTCLVEEDPYFRRSDMGRTFSISGFFDDNSISIIKSILVESNKGLLRGLILELIENSIILKSLILELEGILLNKEVDQYIRELAGIRLKEIADYEIVLTIERLIEQGEKSSLNIVVNLMDDIDVNYFSYDLILEFLEKCTLLYPQKNIGQDRTIGERYFVKNFINNLNYELVIRLLDSLTYGLCCTCNKEPYDCFCRNGISKVIGMLLDHYFKIEKNSYDPQRIWIWLRNLNFHSGKSEEDSTAVKVLQNEDNLRHSLIKLAFEGVTSTDDIYQVISRKLSLYTHSGLSLKFQDYYFILDFAFANNNVKLWSYFVQPHQFYAKNKAEVNYEQRRYAKLQAAKNINFLKEWTKKNLASKESFKNTQAIINSRRMKNGKFKQQMLRNKNIQYIQNNRELIESGKHWSCLLDFANLTLNNPGRIIQEFGDENLVKASLKNCLPFIESHVPNLNELAKAHCSSTRYHSEVILHAACLEIFREKGNLDGVKLKLLQALRTGIVHRPYTVNENEHKAFRNEVDRILFPDYESRLRFLKDYIEHQLTYNNSEYTQVGWLRYSDTFREFQATLPLEWLIKYPNISIATSKTLFDLSAQFCDKNQLKKLVLLRCEELNEQLITHAVDLESIKSKLIFWFIRAFFFLDEAEIVSYWGVLKEQEKTIFLLSDRDEGIRHGDHPFWPILTPTKIWWILDTFIDQWPKVSLPDSWGTGDPPNEIAYRFISNIIWKFTKHISEKSLFIVNNLILDSRFEAMRLDLKSIRSTLIRNLALTNFKAPSPEEIVKFLDNEEVVTVEGLRALILEELEFYQNDLRGGDTTSPSLFYHKQYDGSTFSKYIHLNEVDATKIVADRLKLRLSTKGVIVTLEHQMQHTNRCDITFAKVIENERKLLMLESKGQWHKDLYKAASTQLSQRYSIHPDAEHQGIYFVLWFGTNEKVANITNHGISSAQELKLILENELPSELKGRIDIFVLDVSL
ncbi:MULTISPECIES: hypothetical protein [Acinetobacter]|uniref:hypothetical protein n=1 Tax=Acinetobacter TaxID=469 RepID=UPI000AB13D94|nr:MULTISPECIES: hypothetical protein [Acinetobacter]MCH7381984.1 hypothetical protein [Acinetobacter higginsii]